MFNSYVSERIKICGLTTQAAIIACNDTACGFAGFITHPPSARYVSPELAQELRILLNPSISCVLVSVDATDAVLETYIQRVAPDMLQLHGNESPERCGQLSARYGLPIIKAFGIRSLQDLQAIKPYTDCVDMLLLDSCHANGSSGGVGIPFDWKLLSGFTATLPWFLSGGIGLENIADAINTVNPPYIDVSSALECLKGVKDIFKIRDFMNHIHTL